MAAIIGVQDSLQHVGPQLWFLQSLLGKLILIVHSFAARSLHLCSKQGHSSMQHYLAAEPSYCCTTAIQPGMEKDARVPVTMFISPLHVCMSCYSIWQEHQAAAAPLSINQVCLACRNSWQETQGTAARVAVNQICMAPHSTG